MRLAPLAVCALVLVAAPASAHHSLAAYDQGRSITLSGTIAEFRFENPHPSITLSVAGASWRLEMDNLWELKEVGVDRDTFRPGDKADVAGSPNRDGGHGLYLRRLDRASDGLHYEQIGSSPSLSRRPSPNR